LDRACARFLALFCCSKEFGRQECRVAPTGVLAGRGSRPAFRTTWSAIPGWALRILNRSRSTVILVPDVLGTVERGSPKNRGRCPVFAGTPHILCGWCVVCARSWTRPAILGAQQIVPFREGCTKSRVDPGQDGSRTEEDGGRTEGSLVNREDELRQGPQTGLTLDFGASFFSLGVLVQGVTLPEIPAHF